jgi:small-conductance mechanosensitive channel
MSEKSNASIDSLAETYATEETDTKAYIKAQQGTIINQTRQINELRKKLEELSKQCEQLTIENTQMKALAPSTGIIEMTDQESICLVQIALLKNFALQRELTLEECKKVEIYVKVLKEIKSAKPEKEEISASSLSNEELIALMNSVGTA